LVVGAEKKSVWKNDKKKEAMQWMGSEQVAGTVIGFDSYRMQVAIITTMAFVEKGDRKKWKSIKEF